MTEGRGTRIVILGGGFGGVYTAIALEKLLRRDPTVEIALVSKENYLVFQPMLPEVISGSIGILDTITPIRRLCPGTNLFTRTIESIDLKRRRIWAAAGFGSRQCHLEYDHLVIALGNVTNLAGQPGLCEYALPFKNLGDALSVRNHVINVLEEADIEPDADLRRTLLTFVVAGGGFSGVEAVAELNDFVRAGARSFRHIEPAEIRVVLLHAGPLILPELPERLARFAQRLLVKRGVEIRLDTRLRGATAGAALLDSGERIPTRTLVSTVPSAANPLVAALPCRMERGRVVVDEHLAVPDYPGVWAVGDCAWVLDGPGGQPCPPTAQHAVRQARRVAENIVATLRRQPRRAFAFRALGKMGSLGHHSAVAEILGVKLSGFLAWWVWRTIYLMKLPGLDRKIRVATDWALDLILPPDIVQLRTERLPGIRREHFEPGEIIFHEGDRGDWLYIVTDGEVEMIRQGGRDADAPPARLGPGQVFGELALVRDQPRVATARSSTSVDVIAIGRESFQTVLANFPPLRGLFEELIVLRSASAGEPLVTSAGPGREGEQG